MHDGDEPTTPEVLHLDRTTRMLVDEWVKVLADEPPEPDGSREYSHEAALGRARDTWERTEQAWETVISSRLLGQLRRERGLG